MSEPLMTRERDAQRQQRHFGSRDLDRLARLLDLADAVVPLREAYARRDDHPEQFIALRHDMDHDVENAVRLARWEAERGWRSTYYVLHSDWYWGRRGPGAPSAYVLGALEEISGLGHEIGVHNNAIAESLRTGRRPIDILAEVLDSLRRSGFPVTGTAAHGDPIARKLGFVNSEIFRECPHPDGRASDREIEYRDTATGRVARLALDPVGMATLGLEYEAYRIGHTRYLSEAEGRWNTAPDGVTEEFGREGGFVQVLTHPVHWALDGEPIRPLPTRSLPPAIGVDPTVADPEARPFEIIVRGDCCSRRAINMNRDLFGGNPIMVRDEKSRTDFHLDDEQFGSPSESDIRAIVDVDRLTGSHRDYVLTQTTRDSLRATSARLIVMDSYADMNFTAWRHRDQGWKLWVYADFVRDREAFERTFERAGYLSLEESINLSARLIERYRARVGDVPVLFLHQPTAFYRKLDHRLEFRGLGQPSPSLCRTCSSGISMIRSSTPTTWAVRGGGRRCTSPAPPIER